MNDDPALRRSVRRTVGIAALRKIRRIVDAEQAREEGSRRWAWRLSLVFVLAAVLVLAWMLTA